MLFVQCLILIKLIALKLLDSIAVTSALPSASPLLRFVPLISNCAIVWAQGFLQVLLVFVPKLSYQ